MSDHTPPPGLPSMPPLTPPERARDIGRLHQALAEQLEAAGGAGQAARELQKAQCWLTYALALSQTGPNPE